MAESTEFVTQITRSHKGSYSRQGGWYGLWLALPACLTLTAAATGRGLDYYDVRTVDGILSELQKQDYRFQSLLTAIVQSDAFRMRRGKDQP